MQQQVNLNHIIDQVVKDKGIDSAVLVEALESAVLSAANKKYRNTRELETHFNEEMGEVELFEFVTVVDELERREVLTEIGMAIKAGSPCKHTFVITHCNGSAGYLPPEHLYVEGGYEITSSAFAPQAAEMAVKQAVKMLHEL